MIDAGMPINEMLLATIHGKLEFAFLWPQGSYGSGIDKEKERKWEGLGQVLRNISNDYINYFELYSMSITGCPFLEYPGFPVFITGTKTMADKKRDFLSNSVC